MARATYLPTATRHSLMLLHQLDRIARRRKEIALEPLDLRPRQVVALMILRDHGAMTQAALGETLSLDPANLVGLLNELEDRALLDRRRDPEDRRRHIVELSPAGAATLARAEEALRAVQDYVLAGLDEDERSTLHQLLLRAAERHVATEGCVHAADDDAEGC
jgi:MarR family transcriptional regulator, lower aerobic nicotinate degradation pathway regulator